MPNVDSASHQFTDSLCVFSGIEVKFKNMVYPVILAPAFVPELNTVTHTEDGEYCHQTLQPPAGDPDSA